MKHLDITDLPSDANGSIPGVRRELLKVYNEARGNEGKLKLLSDTLTLILAHVTHGLPKTKKRK